MDEKDKKILTELTLNSRIPINRLAKKAGISREVAIYRLNKLIKEKIILEFYTIIDTETLGFSRYGCLIQLKGMSEEQEKKFIDYLVGHDFISYLGPIIGKWDVAFDVLAKNKEQLKKIVSEITGKIPKNLESYVIVSSGLEFESFPTKIFGSKKRQETKIKKKEAKIEEKDMKILKMLSKDSRVEYKELAGKLHMSANAIKYRIQNLEEGGVIKGYTISTDKRKLGYEFYNIQIKIVDTRKMEELENFLRENSQVIYFYKHLGGENWDMDIGLIAKNSINLREFIIKIKEFFGDILKINDIYIIAEESKGDYAPKGIFEMTGYQE